jgi:hypothetical protein
VAVNLEAQAVIKAKDETGAVIEQVTSKLKKLAQATRAVGSAPVNSLQQAARIADRADHVVGKVSRAIAGGYAAAKVAQIGGNVVETYKTFDDLRRYQKAILGLTDDQQKPLIDQAIRMGGTSRYNDLQVIEAQLSLAQRGVQLNLIQPIVEAAKEYGQAMNAELPEAAKTIEGILFSTGKVLGDGVDALKVARHVADEAVKMAKIGGYSDEDLKEFFKFGGLSGSTAGLSDQSIESMGALMHRANIPGSEAGVAVRAIAGRLVAPTKEGLDALAAVGIDFNKFTSMPGGLSASNLESFMTQRFGHRLSAKGRGGVADILADPEVVGNRSEFISRMFEALSPGFGKGKGGKMRPQDARELTKGISDFYKESVGKVDSEGLLRAIMAANPTLAQMDALFGQKQGARALAAMRDVARFNEYYDKLKNVPEGFAQGIGAERMGGAAGAIQRAQGSWLNLETALGRAWDPQITGAANAIAHLEQSFVELSQDAQKEISATLGVTTALIGLGGALKVMEVGLSGTAAALLAVPRTIAGLAAGALTSIPGRLLGPLGFLLGSTVPANAGETPFGKDWLSGSGPSNWSPQKFSLGDIRSAVGLPAAEVKGSAELHVNVQVEPSDSFVSRIISAIKNEINTFGGGPGSGVGTAGSTGMSMPEAGPNP